MISLMTVQRSSTLPAPVMHGHAAPEQPKGYLRVLRPTLFHVLFSPKHRDCGGSFVPIARRGSFLIRECNACGNLERDFA